MKKILFIFIFFCLSLYSYSQDIIPTKVEWEVTSTEVQVSIHLNIPPKVHVYASEEQFFGIEEIEVLGLGETIQIFPATTQFEDIDGSMVETYENQVVFILKKAFQGKIGTEWKWNGVFSFQGCDNVSCYAPKDLEFSHQGIIPNPEENIVTTEIQKNKIQEHESSSLEMLLQKFSIQNTGFGYMSSDDFLNFLENKKETDSFSGKSIWLILLLILLGGLALN
ncbi:MAG TPA: protein-disulfide reductase DsbD family protein, partial [Planctomycetota bacterium]|nr:protein-disulfide reductase DsbD family protein [Planctomycetota bacterium]